MLTARAAEFLATGPADSQSLDLVRLPAPGRAAEHRGAHGGGAVRGTPALRARRRRPLAACARRATAAWSAVASDDLDAQSFIVVDVETTGARAYGGDRVTEVAAVLVRDGVATTVFDTLINPERPIPPTITAVTNITSAMVRRAPRFAEVCDQLLGALEGHVFVAHNARFDWRFISTEVERVTRRPLIGRIALHGAAGAQARAAASPPQSRRGHGVLRHREPRAASRRWRCRRDRAGASSPARRRARSRLRDARRCSSSARRGHVGRQATQAPAKRSSTLSVGRHNSMIPATARRVASARTSSRARHSGRRPAAGWRRDVRRRSEAALGEAHRAPTSAIAFSSACAAC